ncbi:MAG: histidinol dehydrogenase [Verrucomicrobia bacterium]|nr:histidinol dehydrogenase [Verrucomicrobiota bacterium]
MKLMKYSDPDFRQWLNGVRGGSSLFDPSIERSTRRILDGVAQRGDSALIEFTEEFDGIRLRPEGFAVTDDEFRLASESLSDGFCAAVEYSRNNILEFARRSLRDDWSMTNVEGAEVGEKFDAFRRVGIYVPGGTAPLVSTVLMTVTLARAAGCEEIVVCSPCDKEGRLHPGLVFAMEQAGATEVYRIGGAQAMAAMAYGTQTVPGVQKVFGPGNAYVVAAKRLLFGRVAVDLLPGPSEVLIIADVSANPRFIAADMLAQAEHGSGHERVWFLTDSGELADKVQRALDAQLDSLSRAGFIRKSLDDNGAIILFDDINDTVEVANELAPEHCEIMTDTPERIAAGVKTAGAVCLGRFTPNVLGDYVAGPSHVLPTGGAGASFSGLTVDQFQRRTSVIRYDKDSLRRVLPVVERFAEVEGLDAHGESARLRMEDE